MLGWQLPSSRGVKYRGSRRLFKVSIRSFILRKLPQSDIESSTTATDTTGFVALDDTHKNIIVSFRGSHSIRNWITDFVILPIPDHCPGCAVELGFWTAWEVVKAQVIGNVTEAAKQHPDYEIVVVGHSLGAAIATLSAVEIRSTGHNATLYAFASPRVGNKFMADYITAQGSNNRFAHAEDPVPHLPPSLLGFVHISPGYFINAPNNVTVTTKAIEVLHEDVNFEGKIGSLQHIQDHSWYFGHIDACSSSGTPFKTR